MKGINPRIKIVFHDEEYQVYELKDILEDSDVVLAKNLTDETFISNLRLVRSFKFESYEVAWSWYDQIYNFYLDYISLMSFLQKINSKDFKAIIPIDIPSNYLKVIRLFFYDKEILHPKDQFFFSNLKLFFINTFMGIYSLISLVILNYTKNRKLGIRTEDLIYKDSKSDYRLNQVYKQIVKNNISYIEFIRTKSAKDLLFNILKRRRLAIYHNPIIFFCDIFSKKPKKQKAINFSNSVFLNFYYSNHSIIKIIRTYRFILKNLNIKKFFLVSFSSRSAPIALAANSLNIETIGIMHGLQQRSFAVYEFIEPYTKRNYLGCSKYGVWSRFYYDYFRRHSKVHKKSGIEYSGLLRPSGRNISEKFKRVNPKKIRALFIFESSISYKDVIPYLLNIYKANDIDITIKLRPMGNNEAYDMMCEEYSELSKLNISREKIEDIAEKFDVFIGSNSTAVIEASLFNKISILFYTKKYKDYFEIDTLFNGLKLLVSSPSEINKSIRYRVKNETSLNTIALTKKRFFGDGKDGVQWLIKNFK